MIKDLVYKLASVMSVTGHEYRACDELVALFGDKFDEYYEDVGGTHVFVKKSKKENAPRLMLDAHFDEIGMLVTDIHEGGYLSVTSMGGLDLRVLPAAEVLIYGKKTIYGVIASTPPHLQKADDSKKLPKMTELLVDTGYSKKELEKIVTIGTPIGFYERTSELINDRICGRGMDNKACCAAAINAVCDIWAKDLACDVYVTLSSREEESLAGGCTTAAYRIKPDMAIVTDVTFASFPGVKSYESGKMGEGIVISYSAVCDRSLTDKLIAICEDEKIPYSVTVDAVSTGTNATMLALVGDGIPCAVVSVPISSMHTYNEVVDVNDIAMAARLFAAAVCDDGLFCEVENEN